MPAVMLAVFALTLFLSASLLFLIEPMVGKMMLPLLGGTPAVWNTCMVFFQAILLAGYAFAHWSTQKLGPRKQARWQLAVLALPFVSFLINGLLFSGALSPHEGLILGREGNPIPALLLVLTLSVGLPMFVVCTTAPLLQRWFSSTDHPSAQDPYFLYGASNLGSMLTLVAYPTLVEPMFDLDSQKVLVMVGYGLLAVLTATCALLMWKSAPARLALAEAPAEMPPAEPANPTAIKANGGRDKVRTAAKHAAVAVEAPPDRPVTWLRRVRWVALAAVPSSLMLGVTTYMTTDIAAIPLLWVLPLALYLMTFIIVFQKMTPRTQAVGLIVATGLLVLVLVWKVAPMFFKSDQETGSPAILWLLRLAGLGLFIFSFQLLKIKDQDLIHHVMVMVMPLLVLLLLFMMLSEIKPGGIELNIALHLLTLLIVSMVCHGELARDRPGPKQLTEFFLWMSFGGVVGGLFNALLAPIVFNSLLEYPLMLMVACLLLPPLGFTRNSAWARRADLALGSIFLVLGVALLVIFAYDKGAQPKRESLKAVPWAWVIVGGLGGLFLGGWASRQNFGAPPAEAGAEPSPEEKTDQALDIVLPVCLMILTVGLIWGLPTDAISGRLKWLADKVNLKTGDLIRVLSYGLPCVLCYTFVERGLRFGLGVGGILLVAGVSSVIKDPPMYQDRSFFGVLKVQDLAYDIPTGRGDYPADMYNDDPDSDDYTAPRMFRYRKLLHGTTLHGEQFLNDGVREVPLSYYHRTGPVGQVFRAYNDDPNRAFAVIGLGTGTMACYGLKGQRVDFYDIDPVVVKISYDTDEYFTFIADAVKRGVDLSLILGDARLTVARKEGNERPRLRPLGLTKENKKAERQFGPPLTDGDRYRLMVIDAFSSDAIPVHLITREAIEIYLSRLAEDGVLAIHISNRHLDLHPVLANIVQKIRHEGTKAGEQMPQLCGYHMSDDDEEAAGKNRSHWVAIARSPRHMAKLTAVPDRKTRWERDPMQMALMGIMAWPAPSQVTLMGNGLAAMARTAVDLTREEEEAASGQPTYRVQWLPLEDSEDLQRQLNEMKTWRKGELRDRPWSASLDSADLDAETAALVKQIREEYSKLDDDKDAFDAEKKRVAARWRTLAAPADDIDNVVTFVRRELDDLVPELARETDREKLKLLRNRLLGADKLLVSARQKLRETMAREDVRRLEDELEQARKALLGETDEKKRTELTRKQEQLKIALNAANKVLNGPAVKEKSQAAREALERLEIGGDPPKVKEATEALVKAVQDLHKETEAELARLQVPRQIADTEYSYSIAKTSRQARKLAVLERQHRTIRGMAAKIKRVKKVGVWTDGYSNILSVFNW